MILAMSQTIADLIDHLESRAPSSAAEDWDNVGLLAGDPAWETASAIVSIDLTREALEAAIKKKARLIVTHHPCIFPRGRGLSRVVRSHAAALPTLIVDALQNGIAVAACHT